MGIESGTTYRGEPHEGNQFIRFIANRRAHEGLSWLECNFRRRNGLQHSENERLMRRHLLGIFGICYYLI